MAGSYPVDQGVPTYGSGEPTDALYQSTPANGQQYVDQGSGALYVRVGGKWTTRESKPRRPSYPTGSLVTSIDRSGLLLVDDSSSLVLGTPTFVAFDLDEGLTVSNINFITGVTAASVPTHSWGGICNGTAAALVVQAVTADNLTAAIAASTVQTWALSTPYVVPVSGTYYVYIAVAGTTVCSVLNFANLAAANNVPPIALGTGDTGKTTPYAALATPGALTATAKRPYIWLT